MTVSTTQVRIAYTGDGSSVNFLIPFPFYLATDIIVILAGATLTSGYSISGGGAGSPLVANPGTLTMANAPLSGVTLQVILSPPQTQIVNLVDGTAFPSATLDQVNDRSVQISQRLQDQVTRSIRAPDGDKSPLMLLPVAAARSLMALMFDGNGNLTLGVPSTQMITTELLASFLGLGITAAEIAVGVTVINQSYAPMTVDRYGTNTNPGVTDMLPAINAAVSVAIASGGGTVTIPKSLYFHSGPIAAAKNVTLQGSGVNATTLLSSHAGNGITSTWPVNSSTAVHLRISDLTLSNSNAANTGAGFVDIGGTFVVLDRVRIAGFKYSVILCQSELADIDYCDFEFPLTAGLWCVNGGDYVGAPTASAGFTNRISVYRTQFNNNVGTGTAIIDDGGAAHSYTDINVDGWLHHGRFAGCQSLKLDGGEWEASSGVPWTFSATTSINGTSVTPCFGVTITAPFLGPVNPTTTACINVESLHQTVIAGGWLASLAPAAITGGANITSIDTIDVSWPSTALFDSTPVSYLQSDNTGIQTNRPMTLTSAQIKMIAGAVVTQRSMLTYSPTVAVNVGLGNEFDLNVNNANAFSVSSPTNASDGQRITLTIYNFSGGSLGTISWNPVYHMSSWTSPAAGFSRSVDFRYHSGRNAWDQIGQTGVDVPI